jgi:hypothetical protein
LTQADVETATGISARQLSLAEQGSLKLTESEEWAVSEYLSDRLQIVTELQASTEVRTDSDCQHKRIGELARAASA